MTRAELNGVRFLMDEQAKVRLELSELRKQSAAIVPAINGLPHGNSVRSKVEALAIKIMAQEERIANYTAAIKLAQAGLLDMILSKSVKPAEQTVAILRYVEGLTTDEIAKRTGITRRHVCRLRASAVKKMSS